MSRRDTDARSNQPAPRRRKSGEAPLDHAYATILAGGSGTRFWPASRRALPKQFLAIGGERTLLQQTWDRLDGLVPPERRIVVCAKAHAKLVARDLPALPRENLLPEPEPRNTLPAALWAARTIAERDPDSTHCVLPADHVVSPAEDCRASLRAALLFAREDDALVVFGVPPSAPNTGYGWIERGDETARVGAHAFHAVARFVEKPDLARARRFLRDGRHLWNSGMFAWSTQGFLAAARVHAPETARVFEGRGSIARAWSKLPSLSIDHGVMEHAQGALVLPVAWSWNDAGSWPALAEIADGDAQGNIASGGALLLAEEARGNIVHASPGELVALLGVDDLVVVRSGRALLVCPRSRAQDVRRIVARLEREAPDQL